MQARISPCFADVDATDVQVNHAGADGGGITTGNDEEENGIDAGSVKKKCQFGIFFSI